MQGGHLCPRELLLLSIEVGCTSATGDPSQVPLCQGTEDQESRRLRSVTPYNVSNRGNAQFSLSIWEGGRRPRGSHHDGVYQLVCSLSVPVQIICISFHVYHLM